MILTFIYKLFDHCIIYRLRKMQVLFHLQPEVPSVISKTKIIIIIQANMKQNKKEQEGDGFSSDEQVESQILYAIPEQQPTLATQDNITPLKQAVRDVIAKSYSLQPDMFTGWAPRVDYPQPIPLTFVHSYFDYVIDTAIDPSELAKIQNNYHLKLCYLGPRYESTLHAWSHLDIQFPYRHLSIPKIIVMTNRKACGQLVNHPDTLQFDSCFESGNLDCAIQTGEFEYDLYMRVDSNTKGHLQWYNFRIKNLKPKTPYHLNLCNFQKGKNLYSRNMRPYCYSLQKNINEKIEWFQLATTIKYRKKISFIEKALQLQNQQKFYQMSFELLTEYPDDEVQLAYCVPYTYTRLKNFVSRILSENQDKGLLKVRKLCASLGGNTVEELTITENVEEEEELISKGNGKKEQKINKNTKQLKIEKRVIFITGRCHPGESNGSWMVQGLIDFVLSDHEAAKFLRKHTIFKIIPMLNPDGVILGNYRTGIFGKDFNREFDEPDKNIFPEIYHLKQMFWEYKNIYQQNALIYLDFHGHSVKKNVFAYGPQYPISHRNYYEARMILKLISHRTDMFRYHSCIFRISQEKQTTGRAIFLKSHKIPFTFTIEASNGSYYSSKQVKNCDFDEIKWKQTGKKVIEGVSDYIKIIVEIERIRHEKYQQRQQLLIKGRERVKQKKITNVEMGYFTLMGFRKCRTENNQDFSQIGRVSSIGGQLSYHQLLQQLQIEGKVELQGILKNQQQIGQKTQKNSDDDISEGQSDSQGSNDDLDSTLQNELAVTIKNKKKKKDISQRKKPPTHKVSPTNSLQFDPVIQEHQVNVDEICKQNLKGNNKDILIRRYLWKKRNAILPQCSPKRQEVASAISAKIVNFNFSLNPIECQLESPTKVTHMNATSMTMYSSTNSKNEQNTKKFQRGQEYSESFKKTFLSVQKQILRRDSFKRYQVAVNHSKIQGRSQNNWMVQNVRGKKIQTSTPQYFLIQSKNDKIPDHESMTQISNKITVEISPQKTNYLCKYTLKPTPPIQTLHPSKTETQIFSKMISTESNTTKMALKSERYDIKAAEGIINMTNSKNSRSKKHTKKN